MLGQLIKMSVLERERVNLSLIKEATVFQAEVITQTKCVRRNIDRGIEEILSM